MQHCRFIGLFDGDCRRRWPLDEVKGLAVYEVKLSTVSENGFDKSDSLPLERKINKGKRTQEGGIYLLFDGFVVRPR